MDKKKRLEEALGVIRELSPRMFEVMRDGFHVLNCTRQESISQVEMVVKMYLHAKNIDLTPRVIKLLAWFVMYGTSTQARKKISRQIDMTGGTINQNASKLKREGLLVYPYDDSKKSIVDPALIKLKDYVMDPKKKGSILVKFND